MVNKAINTITILIKTLGRNWRTLSLLAVCVLSVILPIIKNYLIYIWYIMVFITDLIIPKRKMRSVVRSLRTDLSEKYVDVSWLMDQIIFTADQIAKVSIEIAKVEPAVFIPSFEMSRSVEELKKHQTNFDEMKLSVKGKLDELNKYL